MSVSVWPGAPAILVIGSEEIEKARWMLPMNSRAERMRPAGRLCY